MRVVDANERANGTLWTASLSFKEDVELERGRGLVVCEFRDDGAGLEKTMARRSSLSLP